MAGRKTKPISPSVPYGVHFTEIYVKDIFVYSILIVLPRKNIKLLRSSENVTISPPDQLEEICENIREYATQHHSALKASDSYRIADSLKSLNLYGLNLYSLIFGRSEEDKKNFEIIELSREHTSNFYIYSDLFKVPFEFLTTKIINRISPMDFWGSKWNFQKIHRKFPENTTKLKFPLSISVLSNLTFDNIKDVEHKFLIQSTNLIKSINLNEEEFKNARDLIRHLKNNTSQIIHFACHAEFIRGDGESRLHFNENLTVRVRDFDSGEYLSERLIFINACGSGAISSVFKTGFPVAFFSAGAGGVVAVNIDIDDDFAAQFSRKYYDNLIEGYSADIAFDRARIFFLKEEKEVLSLFYSYYGGPSLQKNMISYSEKPAHNI